MTIRRKKTFFSASVASRLRLVGRMVWFFFSLSGSSLHVLRGRTRGKGGHMDTNGEQVTADG